MNVLVHMSRESAKTKTDSIQKCDINFYFSSLLLYKDKYRKLGNNNRIKNEISSR
jgi:hypothetical protein